MNKNLKNILGHIAVILFFVVLVVIYFAPNIFDGKILPQDDNQKVVGMSHEIKEYYEKEGKSSAWTGAMFSGMPTYHIYIYGTAQNFMKLIDKPVKAIGYYGGGMILAGLIAFYILMCVMGVNRWLAIAGSIAFAFASYNIIIIAVGHVTKAYVIAYMPLTIAGMILVFRKKWLLGSALTLTGVILSLNNSHIQITYYLALLCIILYLGYLVQKLRVKDYSTLGKATAILVVCVLISVLPNLGSLYSDYEMGKESLRGKSELTEETTGDSKKASGGLDVDYAFAWSYSKSETMTFLIPNFYGGASQPFDRNSETYKSIMSNLRNGRISEQDANALYGRGSQYWGDQPFTSGPVYFGALVCFLFLLGMFVIKNPAKWWLLGASVFFIFMAWGRHFAFFNEFLFDYLPFYNKFRTPSMSLVIPGLIFPVIAIWGLKVILLQEIEKPKLKKYFYYSLGITGGLCLVFWLMPGAFLNFSSPNDISAPGLEWYNNALYQDREALLKSDAFRSLIFIVLGAALLFWFLNSKNAAKISKFVAIGMILLILTDLWLIDKRFVNYDSFFAKKSLNEYKETAANKFILQDKNISYRVLNLNNPFNETHTSYFHKSIGGYHAAKLGRYQELIDHRITNEMRTIVESLQNVRTYKDLENMSNTLANTPTLNMLNTRYIIFNPEQPPIINPNAYGNAWFVRNMELVDDADAEIAALNTINPLETAVIDQRFTDNVSGFTFNEDENANIEMISYEPPRIVYKTKADSDQLAVFSEIYYPHGWEATIDGKPTEHFRADWTLRGMIIPAGEHTVEFNFIPRTYNNLVKAGSISSMLVLLFLIAAIGQALWIYFKRE